MARVFISYRRRDNAYVAGFLREKLQERFGIDEVFFDLDNIPFGVDFREYIANAVGSCAVLLVVIGDQWLHLTDEQGRRRLDDPSDFVRIEIEAALKRDIPVVPVLIDTAQMPAASELPESVRELAFRNAAEIRAGRDLKQHIERLVSGLAESLKAKISRLAEEDSAPSEEEVPIAAEPRRKITRPTKGTPAAAKSLVEPAAAAKGKISRSKEKGSVTSAEKGSVAPKAREKITHQAKARAAPAEESVSDEETSFLKKCRILRGISDRLWLKDEIPLTKARGATEKYAPNVPIEAIMLLYDDTAFGGAKDGLLLTVDSIYWHNKREEAEHCRYSDIKHLSFSDRCLIINGKKISMWQGSNPKVNEMLFMVLDLVRRTL